MISTPQELRAMTHGLSVSAWTLGTVAFLYESGLAEQLREPMSIEELVPRLPKLSAARMERVLALARTAGVVVQDGAKYRLVDGGQPFAQMPMRLGLVGDIRGTFMQVLAFLDSATSDAPTTGWRHTNPALLQAQGDASTALVTILKMSLLSQMGDLATRLDAEGARFLDVGVGVGSISIGMCRAFPRLRVLGVDSYEVPLAIAAENVKRAGLQDRISLLQSTIETLGENQSFDLAWLPTFFINDAALPAATARVHAALRPGGWIIYPAGMGAGGTDQQSAVSALLTHLWGGPILSVERAESLLKETGFTGVRLIPGPPWAPAMLVAQASAP